MCIASVSGKNSCAKDILITLNIIYIKKNYRKIKTYK